MKLANAFAALELAGEDEEVAGRRDEGASGSNKKCAIVGTMLNARGVEKMPDTAQEETRRRRAEGSSCLD